MVLASLLGCDRGAAVTEAPRASPTPAPAAGTISSSQRRLEPQLEALERGVVANESRHALRGATHAFDLTVPEDAALELAFGVLDQAWRRGAEAAAFRVSFDAEGESRVLLEETLHRPAKDENAWREVELPLAALAGERGTLRLDARVTAGEAPAGDALLWSNPKLLVPHQPKHATSLVLISIDTLRADHLGAYGSTRPTSPAIDAMAKSGILFRNATAASSWTLPSHASLLSGLEPSQHGAIRFGFTTPIPRDVRMLAEQLWMAGYDTAAFTDGFFVSAALGFDQGFDRFRGPTQLEAQARENLELAMQWMIERRGHPFFVFIHSYEAHMPYAPPPPYDTMFDPDYRGPFERAFTYDDYVGLRDGGKLGDPAIVAHLEALYDGEIRHVDDGIGAFLDALERSGLAKSTCVVLTSDHGEEFGEHGGLLHNHAKLYQELLHVPLIVWCPSRFAPREVAEVVGLVDVAPTLLDIAGVAPFEGVAGRSLRAALEGRSPDAQRRVLSEVDGSVEERPGSAIAVRRGRYKRIESSVDGSHALFDLEADPRETRDVSPRVPDVERALGAAAREAKAHARATVAAPASSPVDRPKEATQERLRALGYVLPE